jgi:hypothetical protein
MTFGAAQFISDPADPLKFRGTADDTVYEGGRGIVILDGRSVYVYGLPLPDNFSGKQP